MTSVRKPSLPAQLHSTGTGPSEEKMQEQQDAYFSELLSYSLERLAKEPELLRVDQEQIKRSIQECAVSKYRAFVDTARCLSAVAAEMEDVQSSLDSLEADLPVLSSKCEGFEADARGILANRAANKQLQATHSTVLELLEIPQLADTCVRNGNYDEALDLRTFVAKLTYMHGDLRVVQLLSSEVERVNAAMLTQLLAKLRGAIQLPECLRVIGYLRRLAVFSEPELRLRFLQSREQWLDEQVADLGPSNAYDYLKRLTDLNRLHLFDIVMQFRAIFSDDAAAPSAGAGGLLGAASASGGAGEPDGGILYSWAHHRICLYVDTIRQHLPRIPEGGNLMSVLEHCMYCGMSLGRMGLDFRALLPPMFEAAVMAIFRKAVASSVGNFAKSLDLHKWVALPSATAARDRRAAAAAAAAASGDSGSSLASRRGSGLLGTGMGEGEDAAPPQGLMDCPPLAVFTNGLLAAFNELRHCAPLSVKGQVAALLQDALEQVTSKLISYGVTRMAEEGEQGLYSAACRSYVDTLVPYVTSCYGRIYPGSVIGALDTGRITQPLKQAMRQWEAMRVGAVEPGNAPGVASSAGAAGMGAGSGIGAGASRMGPGAKAGVGVGSPGRGSPARARGGLAAVPGQPPAAADTAAGAAAAVGVGAAAKPTTVEAAHPAP